MKAQATLNYLRIAPRKVRLAADAIRGKRAADAQTVLRFANKRATSPILKLLNSAIANAGGQADKLMISKIEVAEGPKLKRWMPRARGQAYQIQKKTSHVRIELKEEKEEQNHGA